MSTIKISPFIEKNLKQESTDNYLFTAMVSHRGKPISFAMRDDGKIFYSVMDLSNIQNNTDATAAIDNNYWSTMDREKHCVRFPQEITQVGFAVVSNHRIDNYDSEGQRIIQGYSHDNETSQWQPHDKNGTRITPADMDDNLIDTYQSSTARLGAKAPFQVISDGKYIYLFRQAITAGESLINGIRNDDVYKNEIPELIIFAKNYKFGYEELIDNLERVVNSDDEANEIELIIRAHKKKAVTAEIIKEALAVYRKKATASLVHSTLLVDRFIFSGSTLRNSREIRYQRSRHKTIPESRRDTLSAVDVDNNPFYEPTRELACVNNLSGGNFTVLLLPGQNDEQRWQIFSYDTVKSKLNSFNIAFDNSLIFDTSDSKCIVDDFINQYNLYKNDPRDSYLISHVHQHIDKGDELAITSAILLDNGSHYTVADATAPIDLLKKDAKQLTLQSSNTLDLSIGDSLLINREIVRVDEINDDGTLNIVRATIGSPAATEDYQSGTLIKKCIPIDTLTEIIYTIKNGVSKDDVSLVSTSAWQFESFDDEGEIAPVKQAYTISNGMSACYYYLQELIGTDNQPFKTSPAVMLAMGLKDQGDSDNIGILNFSATPEGRISRLTQDRVDLPDIAFTGIGSKDIDVDNQKNFTLIDMDTEGLPSSGGIIRFSYKQVEQDADDVDVNRYSDAIEATEPYLFDDSMGRVNLYFKGARNNFFALYFDPTVKKFSHWQSNTVDSLPKGITPEQLKQDVEQQKQNGINNSQDILDKLLLLDSYRHCQDQITEKTLLVDAIAGLNPGLTLVSRLDRDVALDISVSECDQGINTCTLTMKEGRKAIETWHHLPKSCQQIASILNGSGELSIGTLEPLNNESQERVAYKMPEQAQSIIIGNLQKDHTTVTVADADQLGVSEGNYLHIDNEIVWVNARNANTLTITRGQYGTEAMAYLQGTAVINRKSSRITLRTDMDNALLFQGDKAFAEKLGNGNSHDLSTLSALSRYLEQHNRVSISGNTFGVLDNHIAIRADVFYKAYLTAVVEGSSDVIQDTETLWQYLESLALITVAREALKSEPQPVYIQEGGDFSDTDTTLSVTSARELGVSAGDYITVDEEVLRIHALYGNDILVARGQLGSQATAHNNGTVVNYYPCLINGQLASQDKVVTVTSIAALNPAVGDYLKLGGEILRVVTIDSSRHQVTIERGQLGTMAMEHANGTAVFSEKCLIDQPVSATANQLTVTSAVAPGLYQGDLIAIGDEIMLINNVMGNVITVTRAEESTAAIAHLPGTAVSMYKKSCDLTQKATLTSKALTATQIQLEDIMTTAAIADLPLIISQDKGMATIEQVQQGLVNLVSGIARVRLVNFDVQDLNRVAINRLNAGLDIRSLYDYKTAFTCNPSRLSGVSASQWHQPSSYLVDAKPAPCDTDNVTQAFNYQLISRHSLGQWRNWEAGLAVEFNPTSITQGALLSTTKNSQLKALQPTDKGLSIEAWIKPAPAMTGDRMGTVVYYNNNDKQYSLGIEEDETESEKYRCVVTLGHKQYKTKTLYSYPETANRNTWRHLAFTHKKMWGYQLANQTRIACGNDSSLSLTGEFSLEIMARISASGTLLCKTDEYALGIDADKSISFHYRGMDYRFSQDAFTESHALSGSDSTDLGFDWHKFCKITLIRSVNKPNEGMMNHGSLPGVDFDMRNESMFDGVDLTSGNDGTNADKIIVNSAKSAKASADNPVDWEQYLPKGTGDADHGAGAFDIGAYTETIDQTYYLTVVVTTAEGHLHTLPVKESHPAGSTEPMNRAFILGDHKNADFNGVFCGVRVWDRPLALSEAAVMTQPVSEISLIANWPMTEGKGKYLYDQAGNNTGLLEDDGWVESPQTDLKEHLLFFIDGAYVPHDETDYSPDNQQAQFSLGGIKTEDATTNHFQGTLEEVRIWNQPRTYEQITDNAFGRLKGEWEQLLANYTFDKPIKDTGNQVRDRSMTCAHLSIVNEGPAGQCLEVLSDAPVSTEIPQVRMATSCVITDYHAHIAAQPAVVEYGDVQKASDGTMSGILKRCYSFIDDNGVWHRMSGYKVGNLVSQWFAQVQYDPQVTGYVEGPPPVPGENFNDGDYGSSGSNAITFKQAESVNYNYNTSKQAGWGVTVETESKHEVTKLFTEAFFDVTKVMKETSELFPDTVTAPFGAGISVSPAEIGLKGAAIQLEESIRVVSKATLTTTGKSSWGSTGNRSQTFSRGMSVNTDKSLTASLAAHPENTDSKLKNNRFGNTGYALVKSKTADVYLLRLAHNNALVSINWQPNPDIPADVNIVPFPINPLYTKQGSLDGKFGDGTDDHYPQAQAAYGEYSYFKPKEAYQLKKRIERKQLELEHYFHDVFHETATGAEFQAAAAVTGAANAALAAIPYANTVFNSTVGHAAVQGAYQTTDLKKQLCKVGAQSNLINHYVWTMEGGFYTEATQVTETQQEVYAADTSINMSGSVGVDFEIFELSQAPQFTNNSSLTVTKSKTKTSTDSFSLDVSLSLPTKPRYTYDNQLLPIQSSAITPGTVDAYRFMTFYLEPDKDNFNALFNTVVDPVWLDESPDPNAMALRQARGNIAKAKPCWRIMHRVTYVSRILPQFTPEAPPSLERAMRAKGLESNYMLIKQFEPYVATQVQADDFYTAVDQVIHEQLPEFIGYHKQIKGYLADYFGIDEA